ncbi:leucine--tRNA ligase [archaeon]|nr:leucine--tRNA ligase [archaeon]
MEFKKIEKKWQKKWEQKKLFESDVDKGMKKFFTSNVIPYVNGNAHIGHTYTYTRTDVYARYKRMLGFNVLLAQGFHATGEPILGAVERLRKGDMNQIKTYETFGATEKDIENFKNKGPSYVARFWAEKIEENFRKMGYSIDWRRKFTLSVDPQFSRFIEWQYNLLKEKGYVVQGTHPVVWCPHDQSPTGDHDRLEGEGESPIEYVLIKFKIGDAFLPAATLRPETIYGVTNIWLNPHSDYVKISVEGENWIVSKEAVIKIQDQFKNVKELKQFDEKVDLFGKRAKNPVNEMDVPIIPSEFVDPCNGTGVVMSVPAHAPYDYVAIEEFKNSGEAERFGVTKEEIEPIIVVASEMNAKNLCEEMKIRSTKQEKELDTATSMLYKKEFHTGVLNDKCGTHKGLKVSESKEKIIFDFIDKEIADMFYDVNNVVCRCTTRCHVKILENQWFLKYSDEKWKALVKKCLNKMDIYPEEAKNNFLVTIDWLKDKACTRRSGLGTPLPWDNSWIVETLSDSTIYMAYYTIAKTISKYKIPANKLTKEVLDYVFLGKGDARKAAKSGIKTSIINEMKNEFEYFYPMDIRNSAKDLLQHHLIFFLYHHTAIWPENKWPKCISVNGYVNVEGEKMSKSKGNIIPLKDLIEKYGADMTRINIVTSSEGIDDADWRIENLKGFNIRYDFLFDTLKILKKSKSMKNRPIDLYLLSRLHRIIKGATENYEVTKFRTALNYALFDATNDLKWYMKRTEIDGVNKNVISEFLSAIIRLTAPMTPHICEEMWTNIGKGFVSVSEWPKYNERMINEDSEKSEEFIKNVLDDVREIQKLKSMKPSNVKVFVADDWKFYVHNVVLKNKSKPMNDITKEIMLSDMKKYGNATVSFVQSLYKKINEIKSVLKKDTQIEILNGARSFLEKEIGCKIEIINSNGVEDQKARSSNPQKPGILLE